MFWKKLKLPESSENHHSQLSTYSPWIGVWKKPKTLQTLPEIHLEVQVVDHLLVHLLVDPEKGLAVVVAVALVAPTAAVVVVDTVCHGSACRFFHRPFLTTFSYYKEFTKSFGLFFLDVGTYTPPKNCRITTDQRTRRSLGFFWGVPCNLSFSSSCQNFSSCASIRHLIPKPLALGYLLGSTW